MKEGVKWFWKFLHNTTIYWTNSLIWIIYSTVVYKNFIAKLKKLANIYGFRCNMKGPIKELGENGKKYTINLNTEFRLF